MKRVKEEKNNMGQLLFYRNSETIALTTINTSGALFVSLC